MKTIAVTAAVVLSILLGVRADAKEPLRLIFITCCRDEAFFGPVKQGMRDAARAMDVRCEFAGTEGVDVKAQAEMVRRAVADGYDGIALNVIHPTAFQQVIAEAHAKHVPVVAFNTAARPDGEKDAPGPLAAVCQDYVKAGRLLAIKALDFIPAGSKVLLTQHDLGVASLDARLAGIQEALKARGVAWKIICSSNDPKKARETIGAELKANPQIKIVLATGLTDTEAAGRAIEQDFAGKGYAAAGFDLSPDILRLIKAGTIRFTIDQQPYIQGYYPVVQLALFRRFGIRPADLDAGAGIVGQDDVDRVMDLSKRGYR